MALRNILLNTKLIVIIFFSIPQFIKSDTNVDDNNLIPVHYNVKIQLDIYRNFLFGECNITINITQSISNISLPSINFGIMQFNIIDVNNEDYETVITVSKFSFINETQIYIDFNDSSTNISVPGQYILQIIYIRNILDNQNFIGSLYNENDGQKGLDETGVEVLTAQQLFPCWYEPVFNATFTISIQHSIAFKVISNMIIKNKEHKENSNMMWTHFIKSPFMPIEHFIIVITSFITVATNYNITSLPQNVTVWCREHTQDDITFANVILSHIVSLLLKNGVQTEIKKLDYVAYWDTRHSNILTWGLILQREEDVLYNDELDSIARKIEVANFLANHTLFVWCDSMDWPIEGFTTYFGADILSQIEDLYYMEHLFAVTIQQESFRFDTPSNAKTSFTIHRNLVDESNEIYPYHLKSSVLWRMLRHILQQNVFWYVISTYTIRHKTTGQARYEDLWLYVQNSLNEKSNFPVFNITNYINTWQSKNYYPIVYVEQNETSVNLLFSYLTSESVDNDAHPLPVLITYLLDISGSDYEKYFWLKRGESKKFRNYDLSNVIIVNLEQQGYYRVHYDHENWQKISNYLVTNHTNVHELDLAQIIDDAFYFLLNREVGLTMFWNLAQFLAQSTSFITWFPMFKIFEYITCMYNFEDLAEIRKHMDSILFKALQQIGYDVKKDENDLVMCLREEAAKWACLIDNSECRTAATVRLIEDIRNPIQDHRYTWKEWKYCKGLMSANESVWRDTYNSLQRQALDIRILEYLTCCNDHFFITTYLNQTTLKTNFTPADPIININPLFPNINNRVIIILLTVAKHVKKNVVLDFILNRLESEQLSMTENWNRDRIIILIVAITNLSSNSQLQKINVFATIHVNNKQMVNAIKKKIRKRKAEFGKKVSKYGSLQYHVRR